ncbi:hypothetical protein GCM10010187_54360 [Actinomadura coerulea]|nr:hypothetical protein GCM10010187_54360 [Actinomadura coerulea]
MCLDPHASSRSAGDRPCGGSHALIGHSLWWTLPWRGSPGPPAPASPSDYAAHMPRTGSPSRDEAHLSYGSKKGERLQSNVITIGTTASPTGSSPSKPEASLPAEFQT